MVRNCTLSIAAVKHVSFNLVMNVIAVVELSTSDSDNWFLQLSDQASPRSYLSLYYG